MSVQRQEINDKDIARVISKAFAAMVKAIENEPTIIIEGINEDGLDQQVAGKITSWLFRRRCNDGCPDNRPGPETEKIRESSCGALDNSR